MSFVNGTLLMGAIATLTGCGYVLYRFFRLRAAPRERPQFPPPAYWTSWLIVAFGLFFISTGANSANSLDEIAGPILFAACFASGSCVAVPGVVLFVKNWQRTVRWADERTTMNPPWGGSIGVALVMLSIIGFGIVLPWIVVAGR
jgi:hypothetical protein